MPKTDKRSISYRKELLKALKNPREAEAYLAAALEDGERPDMFLLAVRNVAEAYGVGMTNLAGKAKLNRENLYRILSTKGNPKIENLTTILSALGFTLTVKLKKAS